MRRHLQPPSTTSPLINLLPFIRQVGLWAQIEENVSHAERFLRKAAELLGACKS